MGAGRLSCMDSRMDGYVDVKGEECMDGSHKEERQWNDRAKLGTYAGNEHVALGRALHRLVSNYKACVCLLRLDHKLQRVFVTDTYTAGGGEMCRDQMHCTFSAWKLMQVYFSL